LGPLAGRVAADLGKTFRGEKVEDRGDGVGVLRAAYSKEGQLDKAKEEENRGMKNKERGARKKNLLCFAVNLRHIAGLKESGGGKRGRGTWGR